MPKVSVIIPTYNRPELVKKAVASVLRQTYQDFEIIIVDDGMKERAKKSIEEIHDPRILYIQNEKSLGGGGARNVGIKAARGEYVAFLDDDDEWLPEKLETQMNAFEKSSSDVGFCFSAVLNVFDDKEENTSVEEGIKDYSEISFVRFKGFMTSSLVIRRKIFNEVGGFDPELPSHQEPELILRIAQKYKGLGINAPLVRMNAKSTHEHISSSLERRITGREMVLEKHKEEYARRPKILAKHYFWLGLWYRETKQYAKARECFKNSLRAQFTTRAFLHYLVLFGKI